MRASITSGSFQVRGAAVADATEIARLTLELGYPSSAEQIGTRLEALLAQPCQFVAVAVKQNELLGWIAAARRLLLESGERVEIVGLVVAASARRLGIGKALVASAEQWALARNVDTMAVRSNVSREASHPFYEHLGYIRRKTQHSYSKAFAQT